MSADDAAAQPTSAMLLEAWLGLEQDEEGFWARAVPGPPLQAIEERLTSVPTQFLDERVDIVALYSDVVGAAPTWLAVAAQHPDARLAVAIGCWLAASTELVGPFRPPLPAKLIPLWISALAFRLASVSPPRQWLTVADRREEAARTILLWNMLLPAGEDLTTARSLFDARDSLARNRLLTTVAEEYRHRMRLVRELEKKRAAEAAARYTNV